MQFASDSSEWTVGGVVPCVVRIACRSGSGYFKDEMINVTHAGTMSHNEQIVKIEVGQKND